MNQTFVSYLDRWRLQQTRWRKLLPSKPCLGRWYFWWVGHREKFQQTAICVRPAASECVETIMKTGHWLIGMIVLVTSGATLIVSAKVNVDWAEVIKFSRLDNVNFTAPLLTGFQTFYKDKKWRQNLKTWVSVVRNGTLIVSIVPQPIFGPHPPSRHDSIGGYSIKTSLEPTINRWENTICVHSTWGEKFPVVVTNKNFEDNFYTPVQFFRKFLVSELNQMFK